LERRRLQAPAERHLPKRRREASRSPVRSIESSALRSLPKAIVDIKFLRRISSSVMKRYMRYCRGRYFLEKRMGALLLLDQFHGIDQHILIRGTWEADQINHLKSLVALNRKAGEEVVFLDIGSCVAYYPVILSQDVAFDRIVAFEPVPKNLVQMRANLMLNGMLDKVEVVDKAMSDTDGVTQYIVSIDKNRGWSRILDNDLETGETTIDVTVSTIDKTVDCRDKLIVAKIDTEGGELRVLRGMEDVLRGNRLIMQIERNKGPVSDLVEQLKPFGIVYDRTIGIDHYFLKV
jgi:FkbM family methyltransferase